MPGRDQHRRRDSEGRDMDMDPPRPLSRHSLSPIHAYGHLRGHGHGHSHGQDGQSHKHRSPSAQHLPSPPFSSGSHSNSTSFGPLSAGGSGSGSGSANSKGQGAGTGTAAGDRDRADRPRHMFPPYAYPEPRPHPHKQARSHAHDQEHERDHAHSPSAVSGTNIEYRLSPASTGPSRSPATTFTLPPLHSITQPYPPQPYASSSTSTARRPSPPAIPPTIENTGPREDSPGASSVQAAEAESELVVEAAEAPTPAGSTSTSSKKRRRPAKSEANATADALGIRQTQRVPLSCKECSRRKIKCDKLVPCRPCIERGEEANCKREAVMVKGKIVANEPARPNSTIESLAQENMEIRRRVDRLERLIGRQSPDTPLKSEEALEFKEDRLAGVMEEVALGIGENVRWKGVSMAANPESTSAGKDQWYHSVPFEACLSTIPNRIKSEALVQFFADELYWIDGVVHVPTFVRQHNTFWLKSDQGRVDDDNWLALYFAVLSLAGYFMEADHAQLNGFQPNELNRLAKVWFDCSIAILMRNNFIGAPAFVALQAVQVLRYPFHLSGNTAIHSSIHIMAQRHAMTMNLHLVGAGYGDTQEERLAREMARRVWWGNVEPDWSFLPYLRYCHVFPQQFTTALPDLTDDLEPLSETYDPLHFRLAMCRSARVLYRLFGNLSPFEDPRYEAVLAASEDMEVVAARLPPELQIGAERSNSSTSTACVRRFVQMSLAYRVYLVHRAYYIKSFRDATYAPSRTACIQAATDIITLAERGLPAPFYRLWSTTVWLVAAGIILSLDLVQAADAKREVPDATARRATLGNLVELLYNSGDVNVGIASRGATLIVHLGRAEQEIIAGSRQGAKMTREDILDLISRSEAAPTPNMQRGRFVSDAGTVSAPMDGTGAVGPSPAGMGSNSASASTGAGAGHMGAPGSAHMQGKPFTPPASHRSGSMHSQSLPAESPSMYQQSIPGYPPGPSGGGMGMSGADSMNPGAGGSSVLGPGPSGAGLSGAGGGGAFQPQMQWGGMLDLGMGMGISPGLPSVGPAGGVSAGMNMGMGMGMGMGYGMGPGPGVGGAPGMGFPTNNPAGGGAGMYGQSMGPGGGTAGGVYNLQNMGQQQDGTYPPSGQMPMPAEWMMPEGNALMGFIDELFPPGR